MTIDLVVFFVFYKRYSFAKLRQICEQMYVDKPHEIIP